MKINWTGGGQWKQLRVVKKKSQSENILIKTWPDMVNKEGDRFKIVIYCEIHSVVFHSSRPRGLPSPWNSPGQNTAVGSLSPLQVIFPTQELNPGLPCCRQILYQLSLKGRPRIKLISNIYYVNNVQNTIHITVFWLSWLLIGQIQFSI